MYYRSAVVILSLIAALNAQDKLPLPAALGTHPEIQAMRSQVGRARGGGLVTSTALTIYLLPLLYPWFTPWVPDENL